MIGVPVTPPAFSFVTIGPVITLMKIVSVVQSAGTLASQTVTTTVSGPMYPLFGV